MSGSQEYITLTPTQCYTSYGARVINFPRLCLAKKCSYLLNAEPWKMPSFPTASSKSIPNITTVPIRAPAGNRWQSQIGYFEKSVIKGLLKAVGE